MYSINDIAVVLQANAFITNDSSVIEHLLTDSRRIAFPSTSLFFALASPRRDGHQFIGELYNQDIRNFVVKKETDISKYPDANFLIVDNPLAALQSLSTWHRAHFSYPVVGITGSNGKTIVKEWLNQLLSSDYNVIRSPRSFNSQIGVPLSVWQMTAENNLGIFEAGISKPEEMMALQRIIQPTIGIITNIGEAHSENFISIEQKTKEKVQLFANADIVFYNNDSVVIKNEVNQLQRSKYFSWGKSEGSHLQILSLERETRQTKVTALYKSKTIKLLIPFTDDASVEDAIICWCVCLYLRIPIKKIQANFQQLQPLNMRLQLVKAINNCSVINDSYSFDINSFNIALDFLLQQHQYAVKTVILSDFASQVTDKVYKQIVDVLGTKKINRVITIGENWNRLQKLLKSKIKRTSHFMTTKSFLDRINTTQFRNEVILLKGARRFRFETISAELEEKVHSTVMEINLTALSHNLHQYQQQLNPGTKLMAMIKAGGYGSGSAEVANVLQFQKVDYLAVAYADEGTELRKRGISLPVLILNVDEAAFEVIVESNLEPELFSFHIIKAFDNYLMQEGIQQYPVHIKLDTGMHRLGFEEHELPELISFLQSTNRLAIKSVLSHLAASEASEEDQFTIHQYEVFERCCNELQNTLGYSFIRHIANSAAIFRHPHIQLDMVRLGIGMYGVDSAHEHQLQLQTVCTLKTTIAQLRKVKSGDTVGYNRRGLLQRDSLIATIRIGYADGFSRKLSNGSGAVFIRGEKAPVVGSVCMDMTMVDVTDIGDVKEGDEAEVFGSNITVQEVAKQCETIAYEILTSISQRVKRVYIEE